MMRVSHVRALLLKPIPPTVVRVAGAIVLGVATTVGVAWMLALSVNGATTPRWRGGFTTDVALQVIPTQPGYAQTTGLCFATATRSRSCGTDIVDVGLTWADDGRGPYGSPHALVDGTSFAAEM